MEDQDDARETLAAIGRARVKADAAVKAVAESTQPAVEDALRAGLGPSEIARLAGVTDAYVRRIRKAAGIAPNPKYAYLKPPRAGSDETAEAPAAEKRSSELPPWMKPKT